ncbi:hypothetical protein EHM69_07215 [candidate division KSB1 bacterium]|nr:MAG: hypothetical protein EHM69_07215 [candidate division KSB1 bacterium]
MHKTLLLLVLLTAPLYAATRPVTTFADLLSALEQGRMVRAVIHYGECRLFVDGKEDTTVAAVGGMPLWPYEYFPAHLMGNPKGFLVSSATNLISHRKYGHVYNYVKLKLYDDGEVELTARYLHPKSYKIKMDETFKGRLSTKEGEGGIYLFIEE